MERITLVIVVWMFLLNAISSHEIKKVLMNDSELLYYELQYVREQVQSLSSKVVILETKNSELQQVQRQVQSLSSKVVVLETKNNELQQVQQQVQQHVRSLSSKVVVLETNNKELQRLQNLSCKLEITNNEVQHVQKQLDSMTSKVVELSSKGVELETKYNVLQQVQNLSCKLGTTENTELQHFQQKMRNLSDKLEARDNELQQQVQNLSDKLEARDNELQDKVQNLSDKLEARDNELQHQVQNLSDKLETRNNELQQQVHNLSIKVEKYNINRLQHQVHNLSSKLEAKNNETQYLRQNVQTLSRKLIKMVSNYSAMQKTILKDDAGSVFVRWGRMQCPDNDTELVYSGYTGGSWYAHKGAGTTTLCLTSNPTFGNDSSHIYNYIYGAEFDYDFFGPGTSTGDIPCAVCRSKATSMIMIPGRNICYPGWTKQYGGFLMTGHYDHPASVDFTCVDEHPEFIVGGNANGNGRLLYAVSAQCGSLQCPPYVNGKVITCVVCTR